MKESKIHSQEQYIYNFTSNKRFDIKLQQNENSGVFDIIVDKMQRK